MIAPYFYDVAFVFSCRVVFVAEDFARFRVDERVGRDNLFAVEDERVKDVGEDVVEREERPLEHIRLFHRIVYFIWFDFAITLRLVVRPFTLLSAFDEFVRARGRVLATMIATLHAFVKERVARADRRANR